MMSGQVHTVKNLLAFHITQNMQSSDVKTAKTPISRLISRRCLNRIRRHCIPEPEAGVCKKKYQRISRAFFDVARVSVENYVRQLVEHCVINAQSEKKQSCLLRHCEPSFQFKQNSGCNPLLDDGCTSDAVSGLTETSVVDSATNCSASSSSCTEETKTLGSDDTASAAA
jgi:histone H3/H4